MSLREQTDKITTVAVRQLTKCLSLAPVPGQTQPSEEWLAKQKEEVAALPLSCRRPAASLVRGVIKATELFSDVPFVPDAAVLCKAHKNLHPWRMRSLFLLLASEVGIKSDRIRRHKGVDDLPPSDAVQAFVRRMTSVAGMWIEPEDFVRRFGFAPELFALMQSCCEACMIASVGARAQNLIDLRANIMARQKIGDGYKPALLRFVEAWIHHFGKLSGYLMMESDKLAHELRAVRDAEYEMRRRRNERHRKRTGRNQKLPRRVLEVNEDGLPVPRAMKSTASRGTSAGSGSGSGSTQPPEQRHQAPPRLHERPYLVDKALPPTPTDRDSTAGSDELLQEMDGLFVDDAPVDVQLDGREEGHGEWVDEVGSYYFNNTAAGGDKGKGKEIAAPGDEAGYNPHGWTAVKPSGRVHPAFRTQESLFANRSSSPAQEEKTLTTAEKLHALFRNSSSASKKEKRQSGSSGWRPPTPDASSPSGNNSNNRTSESRRSSQPKPVRPESSASIPLMGSVRRGSGYAYGSAPNPDEGEAASIWTEGTLHSAGGRTDLGLAPPSPHDFLSTLVRDGSEVRSNGAGPTVTPAPVRQVHLETLAILEGRGTPRRPASSGWVGRPDSWSSSVHSTNEQPSTVVERPPSQATEDTSWRAFVGHHHKAK
ncbi:hypothetical protein F5X68DRAFT_248012 [Plectosphaerella plurivora]|uniref:Uncharacterized protein n=1 Tax=Plectosphaerella plurivora TaxID=936078 RepID=A0A9P9AEP0_9PEZI|nr:hypothetical protein F5X68DRAFT_248012 [Plectosphaerella plurivora]